MGSGGLGVCPYMGYSPCCAASCSVGRGAGGVNEHRPANPSPPLTVCWRTMREEGVLGSCSLPVFFFFTSICKVYVVTVLLVCGGFLEGVLGSLLASLLWF